jgi:hypothetical protein
MYCENTQNYFRPERAYVTIITFVGKSYCRMTCVTFRGVWTGRIPDREMIAQNGTKINYYHPGW